MAARVIAWILCAALLVLGQSAAVARAAAPVADQMVICTGGAVHVVYVDAQGQPTVAPHLCPDCATHALAHGAPPAAPTFTATLSAVVAPGMAADAPLAAGTRTQRARAPPGVI